MRIKIASSGLSPGDRNATRLRVPGGIPLWCRIAPWLWLRPSIVTLDTARPSAQAVLVRGDRIVAVGSLDELRKSAGKEPYSVDATFAKQVIVPGLIAQHDHPLLAALTMTSEIIAIEDWVLPQGTSKAAKSLADYLRRLAEANTRLADLR